MGLWSILWVVLIAVPLHFFRRVPGLLRLRPDPGPWAFLATLPLALMAISFAHGLLAFGVLLPLLAVLLLATLKGRRRWDKSHRHADWVLAVTGLLYSILLLAKMGLRPQLQWYGFALAGPALLCGVAWVIGVLPGRVDRSGGGGSVVVGAASAILVAVGALHVAGSLSQYAWRVSPVGEGSDQFRTDEARLRAVRPALETLASTTRPDQTLLVVPEGVTLNYLIRRRTPTPFLNFMPPEFAIYGEDAMIHALQTSPPDRVLFVPKPSAVYGMEFGRDYGARLMAWIEENYSEIGEFEGGEVFRMPFVIRLLAPRPETEPVRAPVSPDPAVPAEAGPPARSGARR